MSCVVCCMIIWWSPYEDMMMMKRCQDHILTENIWFVWSETSYSGDKWRCYWCRTDGQWKIVLLSRWTVGGWVSQLWIRTLWKSIEPASVAQKTRMTYKLGVNKITPTNDNVAFGDSVADPINTVDPLLQIKLWLKKQSSKLFLGGIAPK